MKKEKKPFYKKWWFFVIMLIIFIACILGNSNNSENTLTTSTNSINETINSTTKEKVKTNPYKITNDYDGVYKFVLSSDNGYGYTFTSEGVISFKDGTCNAKYLCSSNSVSENTRIYDGFCGLNENDSSIFYFSLNDSNILYKCNLVEKNFSCELKSEFDLSGCSNSELNLTYVDDSRDMEEIFLQVLEEERIKKEAEEQAKKSKRRENLKKVVKPIHLNKWQEIQIISKELMLR